MDNRPSTSHGAASISSIPSLTILNQMKEKLSTLEEQYNILMDQKEQGKTIIKYIKEQRQAYKNMSGQRYWEKQTQLTIDILGAKREELLMKIDRKMRKIEQTKAAIDAYTKAIEDEDKENDNTMTTAL